MIGRIQLILKTKNISPSQLADQIQVQRSGVSHILSGRNKPSLDFILKVLNSYPEIDADWLLFGKGQMINLVSKTESVNKPVAENNTKKSAVPDLFAQVLPKPEVEPKPIETEPPPKVPVEAPAAEKVIEPIQEEKNVNTEMIDKIVVFYGDNTFKEYKPK
jgi:transcriptional regulator with XRE-family HTH domain